MSSKIDEVVGKLRKTFIIYVVIAALLFIGDVVFHYLAEPIESPLFSLKTWGYFMFIISLFCGVGIPILLRANFQKISAKNGIAEIEGYLGLQMKLLLSVFISCISAVIAYFFPVQLLYLYGAFFSCLYGIYSVIPYKKKIAAEMRFYKLTD